MESWLAAIDAHLVQAGLTKTQARNLSVSLFSLQRRVCSRGNNPGEDPTDWVVARLDAVELLPRIAEAVARLPDGERDALLLYVWEELDYGEIAAALDVPVGTVRSRLNRGALERFADIKARGGTVPEGDA